MKNFEERLARLEEIGELMRQEDISIEKSMQIFEEGIKLAKTLQKELDKMERKVEILVNQPDAAGFSDDAPKATFELFPELED